MYANTMPKYTIIARRVMQYLCKCYATVMQMLCTGCAKVMQQLWKSQKNSSETLCKCFEEVMQMICNRYAYVIQSYATFMQSHASVMRNLCTPFQHLCEQYATIVQQLCKSYAKFKIYAEMAQQLCITYATLMQMPCPRLSLVLSFSCLVPPLSCLCPAFVRLNVLLNEIVFLIAEPEDDVKTVSLRPFV